MTARVAGAAGALALPSAAALKRFGRIALAFAVMGLGALGIVTADFALQWQPVPETLPGRMILAYAAAIVPTVLGAGLLTTRFAGPSALALAIFFFAWTIVLHGPAVLAEPANVLSWLGFCEILAVAAGALMLAAALSSHRGFSRWGALAGRILFGACLPVFGLSHFVSIQFTADMIPRWIPFRLFWAQFTGVAHIAAGAAILAGVLTRLASLAFALMVSGFVLLLHVPRTIAEPADRGEWTMLVMASLISAAAWCAAASIASSQET